MFLHNTQYSTHDLVSIHRYVSSRKNLGTCPLIENDFCDRAENEDVKVDNGSSEVIPETDIFRSTK